MLLPQPRSIQQISVMLTVMQCFRYLFGWVLSSLVDFLPCQRTVGDGHRQCQCGIHVISTILQRTTMDFFQNHVPIWIPLKPKRVTAKSPNSKNSAQTETVKLQRSQSTSWSRKAKKLDVSVCPSSFKFWRPPIFVVVFWFLDNPSKSKKETGALEP